VLADATDNPGTQVGLRLLVEYPRLNKHTRFHRMQQVNEVVFSANELLIVAGASSDLG
jgi:hypothetical protein